MDCHGVSSVSRPHQHSWKASQLPVPVAGHGRKVNPTILPFGQEWLFCLPFHFFASFHLENLKQIGEHIEHTYTNPFANPFANPVVELHRSPLLAPAVRAIDAVRCFFGPESWLGQQRN